MGSGLFVASLEVSPLFVLSCFVRFSLQFLSSFPLAVQEIASVIFSWLNFLPHLFGFLTLRSLSKHPHPQSSSSSSSTSVFFSTASPDSATSASSSSSHSTHPSFDDSPQRAMLSVLADCCKPLSRCCRACLSCCRSCRSRLCMRRLLRWEDRRIEWICVAFLVPASSLSHIYLSPCLSAFLACVVFSSDAADITWSPMRGCWIAYGLISMLVWIFSAAFHTRDVWITEKLDWFSAYVLNENCVVCRFLVFILCLLFLCVCSGFSIFFYCFASLVHVTHIRPPWVRDPCAFSYSVRLFFFRVFS